MVHQVEAVPNLFCLPASPACCEQSEAFNSSSESLQQHEPSQHDRATCYDRIFLKSEDNEQPAALI